MKRQQIGRYFKSVLVVQALAVLFLGTSPALAQRGVGALESGLRSAAGEAKLNITERDALPGLAGRVIASLLSVVAIAFFVLTLYGGFLWMTARGNEEQITKGKNTIIAATIGMIIVLGSYVLTNFVFQSTAATPAGDSTALPPQAACIRDSDCGAGLICTTDGVCLAPNSCRTDGDCLAEEVCVEGVCHLEYEPAVPL